ncbi:hypothetical protein U9M48_033949 [Paspalum notatum var. saurae]|uniref:3-beta hydroxysteroid dehydrogenase/isomerase domain-containing protein n=1 Tax=Paspalum notatum var. saurae TaxID=547442 RepID=A0AAQ3UBI8_PASNO
MSAGDRRKNTACVTGGSGYIGSALIKLLLEKGYAVKTTVRNPDDMAKNSHIKGFQALGPLEVFRADLEEEGSFDEAVAGCDYAFLVAAPVNLESEDPEREVIEPAVRGTLNVMRSCAKAGTVKRVVLTSSVASIMVRPELQGDGHVLDEESWSDADRLTATKPLHWVRVHTPHTFSSLPFHIRSFKRPGHSSVPSQAYQVSKVLVEKAACGSAEEHGISLVTICPVVAVGAAPAPSVRTSVPSCLSLLSGDEAAFSVLRAIEAFGTVALVHIEDLCRAELFVAEEEAAAGRYLCCSLNTTVLQLARFLADKYPQYAVKTNLLSGELLERPRVCLSSAKLVREGFDYKYKKLGGMYDDTIDYGKALGILPN